MPEDLSNLAYLVLGFLFGLLGGFLQERFRRKLDREEFHNALVDELRELALRLAFIVFHVRRVKGGVDRAFLQWLSRFCRSPNDIRPVAALVEQLLAASDEEIRQLIGMYNAAQPSDMTSDFKKFYAPVLSSRINQLGSLPAAEQLALLNVDARLRMYHEQIDRLTYFFDLTFTATGENHARAKANCDAAEGHVGRQAELICDAIAQLPWFQPSERESTWRQRARTLRESLSARLRSSLAP